MSSPATNAALIKARAERAKRRQQRTSRFGDDATLTIVVPVKHLELINEAAMLDHRTAANFVYHASVMAAQRLLQEAK